ncbi:MAG: PEGA domain-containing protein [Polyangiaceae bacterium]
MAIALSSSSTAFAQGAGPTTAPAPAPTPTTTTGQKSPAPGSSAAMDEARVRYERGLSLYAENNYEAACIEFARAYQLAPAVKILYNIGVCDSARNDYVAAMTNLRKYLQQGGNDVPAERRKEVEGLLRDLEPRIGVLTIKSNVTGATVSIDDVPVGTTPLDKPIEVNPGRRRISVSKTGWLQKTQSLVVAGSDKPIVEVDLEAVPVRVEKTTADLKPYIFWGLAGAFAVGAGITGYVALKTSSDLDDADGQLGTSSTDREGDRTKMRTFGIIADTLGVCAIASAGAALYFTIKPSKKDLESPPGANVKVGVRPGGLMLQGTF